MFVSILLSIYQTTLLANLLIDVDILLTRIRFYKYCTLSVCLSLFSLHHPPIEFFSRN